jgi:sialic acid synthase SpsE
MAESDLPVDTLRTLHKEKSRIGLEFLSTPFDEESAELFDSVGASGFKIASKDLTRRTFVQQVARKGKPVVLCTGKSAIEDIENAIEWIHSQSNCQVVLLHGRSSDSTGRDELDVTSVQFLATRFDAPVGFSDHSSGSLRSIVATSLGAQVIERRFTIETRSDTMDNGVSMDAKTFKTHIEELRRVGAILTARGRFDSEAGPSSACRREFLIRSSSENLRTAS